MNKIQCIFLKVVHFIKWKGKLLEDPSWIAVFVASTLLEFYTITRWFGVKGNVQFNFSTTHIGQKVYVWSCLIRAPSSPCLLISHHLANSFKTSNAFETLLRLSCKSLQLPQIYHSKCNRLFAEYICTQQKAELQFSLQFRGDALVWFKMGVLVRVINKCTGHSKAIGLLASLVGFRCLG